MIISVTIDGVEHYGGTTQVEDEIQAIIDRLRSENAAKDAEIARLTQDLAEVQKDREYCLQANILNEEVERREIVEQQRDEARAQLAAAQRIPGLPEALIQGLEDAAAGRIHRLEDIDPYFKTCVSMEQELFTDQQIKYMRDRFLNWTLPENLNPDGGISYKRSESSIKYNHPGPVGTNFLDAEQAEAMVRHMIEGLFAEPSQEGATAEIVPATEPEKEKS